MTLRTLEPRDYISIYAIGSSAITGYVQNISDQLPPTTFLIGTIRREPLFVVFYKEDETIYFWSLDSDSTIPDIEKFTRTGASLEHAWKLAHL